MAASWVARLRREYVAPASIWTVTVHTVAVFPRFPNPLFAPPRPKVHWRSEGAGRPDKCQPSARRRVYVGELRGFPFVVPSHIWRIDQVSRDVHWRDRGYDRRVVDWAGGLAATVVSIAFGPMRPVCVAVDRPGPSFMPGWATPGCRSVDRGHEGDSPVYSALSAPANHGRCDGTIFETTTAPRRDRAGSFASSHSPDAVGDCQLRIPTCRSPLAGLSYQRLWARN